MARFFYVAGTQEYLVTVVQLGCEMSRKPRSSTMQKFNEAAQLNFDIF